MAETTATVLFALGTSAATAKTVGAGLATAGSIFAIAAPIAGAVSSMGSAGLQIAGGQQQGAALEAQAAQSRIQATSERLRGQAQANQTRQALLRTLSAQNARYASSGLAIGTGSPEALAEETRRQAEQELGMLGSNAELAALGHLGQADALDSRADETRAAATWRAGFSLFDAVDRVSARRPGTVQ